MSFDIEAEITIQYVRFGLTGHQAELLRDVLRTYVGVVECRTAALPAPVGFANAFLASLEKQITLPKFEA